MATGNVTAILRWYAAHQRDLPWRRPDATPWAVLVSEVMLQQTPVTRVLPVVRGVAHPVAEASITGRGASGRTPSERGSPGLPQAARSACMRPAQILTQRHGGEVPSSVDALIALPGIGSYTAAAVASFAFGQRQAVLDTNVRRVLARLFNGQERPRPAHPPPRHG